MMTPRIKKIFIGLVIVAISAFAWFFSFFKNFLPTSLTASISSQSIPETPLTLDSDKDGLTDRNEIFYGTDPFVKDTDGDGFVDGEEVATGHDPRKLDQTGSAGVFGTEENGTPNLTNRFVNQTVANLIGNNGQVDTSQFNNKTFASIARSTITDSANITYIPPVTDNDIKIIKDTSKKSIQKYLGEVMPIIEESQIGLNTVARQLNSISGNPFDGYIFFQEKYITLKSISVPETWKNEHKELVTIYLKFANSSNFFNVDKINEDPMKAMLMINTFQDTIFLAQNSLTKLIHRANKEKVEIENSIFNTINKAVSPR